MDLLNHKTKQACLAKKAIQQKHETCPQTIKQGGMRPTFCPGSSVQFSSVQSLSCVRRFETPWTAARQDSLSITNSRSLLKLMSIELVMPSNISVMPFSSHLQSFPASGSFQMSQFFASGHQSIKFQLQHQFFQ